MDVAEPISLAWFLTLETKRDGRSTGRARAKNIPCTAGLNDLAAAVAWAGSQDQASLIGSQPAFLTPLYGAIGTGTGTPAITDTQLYAELSRAQVSAVVATPLSNGAATIFQFQFPVNGVNYTITEAGLFSLASVTVNSGDLLDHALISPSFAWTAGDTMTLSAQLGFTG